MDSIGVVVERAVERLHVVTDGPIVNMPPIDERFDKILDHLKWLEKLTCVYPSGNVFNMY